MGQSCFILFYYIFLLFNFIFKKGLQQNLLRPKSNNWAIKDRASNRDSTLASLWICALQSRTRKEAFLKQQRRCFNVVSVETFSQMIFILKFLVLRVELC